MPSDSTPLQVAEIGTDHADFSAILAWDFRDEFVGRMLREDIPIRAFTGSCIILAYRDADGNLVGFGALDCCDDLAIFTEGRRHYYIPLLAVSQAHEGRGHGKKIVRDLIDRAAIGVLAGAMDAGSRPDHRLFLDVYASSERAKGLYEILGFRVLNAEPWKDPDANDAPYFIMAKNVAIAPG